MGTSKLSRFAFGLALAALGAYPLNAAAYNSRGAQFDARCASLNPPQKSQPYFASGSNCSLCHAGGSISLNFTPLGKAIDPTNASTPINTPVVDTYCVNTPPTTASITAPAANGTTVAAGGSVTFTGSSTDPDGFALIYAWNVNGTGLTGQTVNYTVPTNAATGATITATLTVTDNNGTASANIPTRSITVAAAPTPTAPTAANDNLTAVAGVALNGNVLSNDGGTAPLAVVFNPATLIHGTLSNTSANGSFTYTPSTTGSDSFTYTVSNSAGSAVGTVTITVNAAPPPTGLVANPDSYTVQAGKALSVPAPGVLANDTGGTLTAQKTTSPANAKVFTFASNGGFSYTPKSGFSGTDGFTYQAKLGTKLSAAATVTIRVTSGPCQDKDLDGYSPEGKSCGPLDCDDNNASVTTCTATKACIDKLVANMVNIDSAAWKDKKLKVAGSKAPKKATVRIYDAVTSTLLGTARAEDSGAWTLTIERLSAAPCRVKAEINGANGQRAVSGAPTSCVSSGEPSCGSGGSRDDDDDGHESDEHHSDSKNHSDDD